MTGSAAVRRLLLAAAAVFILAGCDQLQMGDTLPSPETTEDPPALLEDGGITLDGDAGTITLKFSGEVEDFAPLDYIKIEPAGSSGGEKVAVYSKGKTVDDDDADVRVYMELVPKGVNEKGEYEYEIKLEAVVKFPPSRTVTFAVSPADKPEPQASMLSANVGTALPAVQFSELGADTIELDAMIEVKDAEFLALINTGSDDSLKEKYKQTADITISGTWMPIGVNNAPFIGVFDGGGYDIIPKDVNIGSEDTSVRYGIFGYAKDAKFENIHIGAGSITTSATTGYLGGIAGYTESTQFINCSNDADLTSAVSTAGICGYLDLNGLITGCWNTGDITGGAHTGGICTSARANSTIKNSFNIGNITMTKTNNSEGGAGGIAGSNHSNAQIIACYNTGEVMARTTGTGVLYAGGICGSPAGNADNGSGQIAACYNTGNVSSDSARTDGRKTYIGGISGYNSRGSVTITASYSTGTVTYSYNGSDNKGAIYIGGISGYSTYNADDNVKSPVITGCYWTVVGDAEHGIGSKKDAESDEACSDEGTTKFSDSWPANSTHDDWGTKYWKSISDGSYPKLAWEKN
jgi:hypothetical protein